MQRLRIQRRMTLRELAVALDYTPPGYISEVEAGKKIPTAEFILKVSRSFEVSTDMLMKDELEIVLGNKDNGSD